jgi:aryl-alcohol dehydrogenase-like predicted oxidoreductase
VSCAFDLVVAAGYTYPRVSPLQLGAMSVGSAWSSFMNSMDKESSFKLLDAYADAGGNFIDTANNYQNVSHVVSSCT